MCIAETASWGYWAGTAFLGPGRDDGGGAGRSAGRPFAALISVRIQAEVYAPNKASQVVLEKAGFALEGVRHCGIYKNGSCWTAASTPF